MGVFATIFGKTKAKIMGESYKELGSYNARFSGFGSEIYRSDIVKSCVRTLSEHTSKANPTCTDKRIQRLLENRPNIYMNGKDFLAKVRIWLEVKNTAFIYIERDDMGRVIGFYPVPYSSFEAIDYGGVLFIQFTFVGGQTTYISWDDLAVLRKDYYTSDIGGDSNESLLATLDLIQTTNQGIANAIKATANLRGIIKHEKAMLDEKMVKASRDRFVKDYMGLSNEGGIAALDAGTTFIPITMTPQTTSYAQMKEFRESVYRYFGVNESIITSDFTETQFEAFHEARIEPFLVALSLELTNKVFTQRELGFKNAIVYESNRLQYASMSTKLAMVALVDRGLYTPNEMRKVLNMAPIEGGDQPIRRLDTAVVEIQPVEEKEEVQE